MKRSWRNNSNNSSPGFVYYSVNNSYQSSPSDTSDYLSFGDSPTYNSPSYGSPKPKKFSPTNYSSPRKFQSTPKNFNKRNNYHYSGGHNNHSYNSSNNSFNSSHNNSRRDSGPHHRRNFNNSFNNSFKKGGKDGNKKDMSMFFDHTCLKDPWAELEADLKKRQLKEEETKTEEAGNIDSPPSNDEDSSSNSEEEAESESESKTSTSGVEEEAT